MRYRISRIAVHQTALVLAVFYGVIALVAMPFIYLGSRAGVTPFPGYLAVVIPPVYALFGYIFGALACWIYNVVARWVGGVELVMEPHGNPPGAQ